MKVPPILLEGDAPVAAAPGGPGQRYVLGPTSPPEHIGATEEPGELPEAYGTQRLLLTARDPRWLYSHWDLTRQQLKKHNALSADGHLVLRVYADAIAGQPASEIHVHPESRHWFVPVERGGTKYLAELGYYLRSGKWVTISVSGATVTPPESLSEDTSAQFATMPVDVSFDQLLALVKTVVRESVPLVEAIAQLRASGYAGLPAPAAIASAEWTPEQERALAQVIGMDSLRRVWMGSLEITELVRRQLFREISSAAVAQFSLPTSPGAVSSISSPFGGEQRPKGFWFNVNAELIVYGATESDATVTIGGRVIKLRPDGSFSYRFALPDGSYELPIVALSADKSDGRAAELKFDRQTGYVGQVGAHPQDPNLKAPRAESVA